MNAVLSLKNFSLAPKGPTVALKLAPGQSICVLGPAGSGKSRFVRALAGEERPAQGEVSTMQVATASLNLSKRSTPVSIAKRVASRRSALASEALYATELWEVRDKPLGGLSDSQVAAAELLSCLAADADLLIADTQLDRLDPWTRSRVWRMLRARLSAGTGLVAVTNRPEAIADFDLVVVLHRSTAKFVGSAGELLRKSRPTQIRVRTMASSSVDAITQPFHLKVEKHGRDLTVTAPDGQDVAARLLLEGYGEVQAVGLHEPSAEGAILDLIKHL